MPERVPKGKVAQLMLFGVQVINVKGNCAAFRLSVVAIEKWGWYNRNAAINPYLLEGKKTVSLEITEQLGGLMPWIMCGFCRGRLHLERWWFQW
jgi:threonine synthase